MSSESVDVVGPSSPYPYCAPKVAIGSMFKGHVSVYCLCWACECPSDGGLAIDVSHDVGPNLNSWPHELVDYSSGTKFGDHCVEG